MSAQTAQIPFSRELGKRLGEVVVRKGSREARGLFDTGENGGDG